MRYIDSFKLSTEAVTGKATHQIVGDNNGVDENVYRDLRALARGVFHLRLGAAPAGSAD